MHTFLLVIHVFVAIGLISLVLIQQGKGSDMGAGFGAGSSGTVFGARGAASFLAKVTGGFALLFFLTSIGLAVMASRTVVAPNSLIADDEPQGITETITLDPSALAPQPAADASGAATEAADALETGANQTVEKTEAVANDAVEAVENAADALEASGPQTDEPEETNAE